MALYELFIELAEPDENGCSRWVSVNEFVGKYAGLTFGNGGSWNRKSSTFAKKYKFEVDKSITSGNSIDRIRLTGHNNNTLHFKQTIRKDIRDYYKEANCVMLGVRGKSENTTIEIDHKDGRKSDHRVSDLSRQTIDDFQPLSKAANDAKRQICKKCKETNQRWNAKELLGNPYSYYKGDVDYSATIGCVGCYQYDPVTYRKSSCKRISEEAAKHTTEYIMKQLYPEDFEDKK